MLGVPVQLASAASDSRAKAQVARLKPLLCVRIPATTTPSPAKTQIHAGGRGHRVECGGTAPTITPTLVDIVTVELALPFAAGVTGFCENAHVASPGNDEQLSVIAEENPATEFTVTVVTTLPGALTVAAAGDAETVKSGFDAIPVPESATV